MPIASVNELDQQAYDMLNWICVVGGAAGVLAAFIPERIVRWTVRLLPEEWHHVPKQLKGCHRIEFDSIYFRLWEEFGCHVMLSTVWMSYGLTVWANFGFIKGYSFGLAAALWFTAAGLWRGVEIFLTLKRSGTFRRPATAIVGAAELDEEKAGGSGE